MVNIIRATNHYNYNRHYIKLSMPVSVICKHVIDCVVDFVGSQILV